jgi:hypothetical protein
MNDAHDLITFSASEPGRSVNPRVEWHFFRGIQVNYQSRHGLPTMGACYGGKIGFNQLTHE